MQYAGTNKEFKEPFIVARQSTEESDRTEVGVGTPNEGISLDKTNWPEDCLFFDPYIMDANYLHFLLWQDSVYVGDKGSASIQRQLSCIGFEGSQYCLPSRSMYNPSSDELSRWLSETTSATKIMYVGAKRKYLLSSTRFAIGLPLQEWLQVLHSLQIIPSALEMLHDNNSGFSGHITNSAVANDDSVSAFHICIKLSDTWPRDEHFIVACHDFLCQRNLVLIAGTDSHALCELLSRRLSATERSDIFCIVVATLSLWLIQAEKNRWKLDYDVQKIEKQTDSNSVQYQQYEPPTPKQLSLTKDMSQTRWSIGLLIASMENTIKSIDFAKEQHLRHHAICCRQIPSYNPPCPISQIQGVLSQYRSQACSKILQMQTLRSRVAAQIAVTNTLIAHRDSRATIDLAMAMKADSKLMKRLSLCVTFFHVGGSEEHPAFEVSRWIWLYPLCTVPLTLFLVFQYGLDAKSQKLLQTLLAQSRSYFPDRTGDSEAQAARGEGVKGSSESPERK